ncbi:hypothetical protein HBI56_036860 [Parastagonospora nodorum]|uniref:Uncharacterized protein n=1 Tax=Phaeosphaeria nodorum (strain SN15 / ATCC MYA-4574 / FGSC 10173) TaxID=321614 RepID=A0A7U2HZC1_PHANO|nr:hypothetical protein HBH56_069940 [Parastagonospora nodorum]QRC93627.1 hypothetical protein JI435_404230 [Parastagonospora nodorum SN15]KAH3932682.1 hypothetical protein HBH54_078180 [Parastagonospora nodorum]KAH3954622.1 hypothetical protein HBH53_016190 [Parastagonospora nodorum]KAH3986008.1 hypothetical protein HBH52_047340 [Parastagonospora nodorum]
MFSQIALQIGEIEVLPITIITSLSRHHTKKHHLTSSLLYPPACLQPHPRVRVEMTTFVPVVTLRHDPRAWQRSGPYTLGIPMLRCLSVLFSVRLKACSRRCRPLFEYSKQAADSTRSELRTSFISN